MAIPEFQVHLIALTDEQLGFAFWDYWLAVQAIARRIPLEQVTAEFQEQIRTYTFNIDADLPASVVFEKVLKFCAIGKFARAGRILRATLNDGAITQELIDELRTGKRRQRALAEKDRADPLAKLIAGIVNKTPDISEPDLRTALRAEQRHGVIDEIDDIEGAIWLVDKHGRGGESVPLSGLKDRLSRAKKKLKSR